MNEEMKTVYRTSDYDMFKTLKGNRDVTERRVKKIIKSIETVGYITSPVIVNENMEIIDGQARVEAFQRLGIPVEYIIHPGAGIKECRSMNINQTNWSDKDYVSSFAMSGSEDYSRFQQLLKDTGATIHIALCSVTKSYIYCGGSSSKFIRSGELKCTRDDYERAKFELYFVQGLKDVASIIGGRKEYFQRALLYAYRMLNINQRQELEERIRKNVYMIPAFTKISDYLKYFDEFYNKGKGKQNRINLFLEWETEKAL